MGTPDVSILVAFLVAGEQLEEIALAQGWDEAETRALSLLPGVSALVEEARESSRLRARLKIEKLMDAAVTTLEAVMSDPESSASSKVAACREILSRGGISEPIPPASPLASRTDDELLALIEKVTGPRAA